MGLAVVVLAGGDRRGTLDTTGAGAGMFWEGAEGLVERDFALALGLFVSNSSEESFLHCWLINCHLSI